MPGFKNPIERAQEQLSAMTGVNVDGATVNQPGDVTPPEVNTPPVDDQIPPQPETPPKEDPNGETFKARWETLQGMYKSAREENAVLQGRIGTLEAQVAGLTQQLAEATAAPSGASATPPNGDLQDLISQISDEVGVDLTEKIHKLVRSELDSRIAPVKETMDSVASENLKTRQERFEEALTAQVDDWRSIYVDPQFVNWLQTRHEELSGISYMDIFSKANNEWNLNGLANIFKQYKKATGMGEPPTPNVNTPTAPSVDPREPLVTPGRSHGGSASSTAPQGKVYKMSEVNQFFKDVALGKYRGRDAEVAAMDAEITRANLEGRIVAG
jgi:hypothetical protein